MACARIDRNARSIIDHLGRRRVSEGHHVALPDSHRASALALDGTQLGLVASRLALQRIEIVLGGLDQKVTAGVGRQPKG